MEGIMTKRLDLRVDFAFKSLFGTHGNESILAAFLNAALRFPNEKKFKRFNYWIHILIKKTKKINAQF